MAFSWGKLADLFVKGLAVAIPVIEKIDATKQATGPNKKAAALDLVTTTVAGLDTMAPQVLAHPKVQAALSVLNDAIVAVHNATAEAQGATDQPPAPSVPH